MSIFEFTNKELKTKNKKKFATSEGEK